MTKADSPNASAKLETITLKAFIHCEGCRRKIRRIIRVLDGVEDVEVDSATGKVTVTGLGLDSKTILQRLQKYKKAAEVWPSANASPNAGAKSAGGNQPKPANNNTNPDTTSKKKNNAGGESGGKPEAGMNNESKKGGGKKEEAATVAEKGEEGVPASEQKPIKNKELNASSEAGDENKQAQNGGSGGGGGKKGKKGGNAGNNGNNNGGGGGGSGNNGGNGGASQQPPPHIVHDQPIASTPTSTVTVSANKSLAPSYDSVQTGYSEYNSVDYATHMFSDENANNCSIM